MHAWAELGFFGGHVALDFLNTVDNEGKTRGESGIADWDTAVEWALVAGIVDGGEAATLREAGTMTARAGGVEALHALREPAWRVLSAIAAAREADPGDLADVEGVLKEARGAATLAQSGHGLQWRVGMDDAGTALLRLRVALALDDLLSRTPLERLRECGRCTGAFPDYGRGAGRRWCRMETCGNRAKIERHRRRAAH